VVQERDLQVASLSEHIATILSDGEGALFMARAAASQAVPDATERLVALVEGLAEGKKGKIE
jgi:UDP-N-acetylglucosamine--N-acetylmuramyl-(pentapeptide) pyrophosphoryl-undecaprenol N-acetylglucosamine transferase